jgi:hypothetical protein
MESRRRRIARWIRIFGIAAAAAIIVMGIYLPMAGWLDWALLPFLLAFVPFAVADIAAWMLEDGARTRAVLRHSQSHPLR